MTEKRLLHTIQHSQTYGNIDDLFEFDTDDDEFTVSSIHKRTAHHAVLFTDHDSKAALYANFIRVVNIILRGKTYIIERYSARPSDTNTGIPANTEIQLDTNTGIPANTEIQLDTNTGIPANTETESTAMEENLPELDPNILIREVTLIFAHGTGIFDALRFCEDMQISPCIISINGTYLEPTILKKIFASKPLEVRQMITAYLNRRSKQTPEIRLVRCIYNFDIKSRHSTHLLNINKRSMIDTDHYSNIKFITYGDHHFYNNNHMIRDIIQLIPK